jgi:predicted NodU family carbamoyl transferase
MLQAVRARPVAHQKVPGVIHADGTVRLQTVDRRIEPLYHRLISAFDERTGVPVVLNTSFNGYGEPIVETPDRLISAFDERTGVPVVLNTSFNGYGEPIVETPEDAVRSMLSMGLDGVFIGDYFARKAGHPSRS